MRSIIVEPYVVSIKPRNKRRGSELQLDKFRVGSDIFSEFNSALSSLQNGTKKIDTLAKAAKVTAYRNKNRMLKGRLNVGEFGTSSPIVNVDSGKKEYDKKKNDADIIPFYFGMHLPQGRKHGVIILQRIGKGGIRSVLEHILVTPFREKYEDLILQINPLAPEQAIKHALKSNIHEVQLIQHSIPSDIADKLLGVKVPKKSKLIVTVKSPENPMSKLSKKIPKIINGKSKISELVEIDNFSPNSLKAMVKIGDRERVIDISDRPKFKPSFDISEDVSLGPDAYPKFSSIDTACDALARDLLKGLN